MNNAKKIELKPCPFCKEIPIYEICPDGEQNHTNCKCGASETFLDNDMIEQWNSRPIEDEKDAKIAEQDFILSKFAGWYSDECPSPCPFRDELIQNELESGNSETIAEAEAKVDMEREYCQRHNEEGMCWIKHYQDAFRTKNQAQNKEDVK